MESTMKNIRLSDIADELGVTVNTVSKAIRGAGGISERCRKEILEVADRMGYVPNRVATSLRYGQSKMVAIVFDTLVNPYYMIMTDMLLSRLNRFGYDVIIFAGIYNQIRTEDLSNILGRQVDGIITFIEPQPKVLEILKKNRIEIVLLGRQNKMLEVDSVSTDDFRGGYLVGEYIMEKQRKNVGYLGTSRSVECSQRRLNGLVKGLAAHGYSYQSDHTVYMEEDHIEPLVDELIAKKSDAIFCFNDIMALRCISCLRQRGLRVPEDVLVVGYDDIHAEYPVPTTFVTVSSDKKKIVDAAVDLLLEKIARRAEDLPENDFKHLNFDVSIKEND